MGVWDYVYGAGESVKSLCSSSYGYTKASVCYVKDNAGNLLSWYWPTKEAQSKIIPFAKSVAKYSAEETVKFVPGGRSAYKILKNSLRDANKSEKINDGDHKMVEVKALAERLEALEREIGEYKRSSVGQSQTETNVEKAVRLEADTNPESVIREFMEKEFMGRQFLNNLLVPGTSRTV